MTLKVLLDDHLHPYHNSRNSQLSPDEEGPQHTLYEVIRNARDLIFLYLVPFDDDVHFENKSLMTCTKVKVPRNKPEGPEGWGGVEV
jgi:hypothetical protein